MKVCAFWNDILCTLQGWAEATLQLLKPEYSDQNGSIPWLLMPWLLLTPSHQQPWCCMFKISISLSSTNLHHSQLKNTEKMEIHVSMSAHKESAHEELILVYRIPTILQHNTRTSQCNTILTSAGPYQGCICIMWQTWTSTYHTLTHWSLGDVATFSNNLYDS